MCILRFVFLKKLLLPSHFLVRKLSWVSTQYAEQRISSLKIEHLKERSFLSITGQDAIELLQELSTNDVNILMKEKQSLYTMFLNNKGRVLHDAILYKFRDDVILIETDINSIESLQIHLALNKTHKRVFLKNEDKNYSAWAIFNPNNIPIQPTLSQPLQSDFINDISFLEEINFGENVIICYDPRILPLGVRIVAPKGVDISSVIRLNDFPIKKAKQGEFKILRYKLGVSEGSVEIQYGKYQPQEVNCDYLNALGKKKENCLGLKALKSLDDESVKMRIMPIKLNSNSITTLPINTPIFDVARRKKSPLGYLRGIQGELGIAIIRVFEASDEVRLGNIVGTCIKPFWWPGICEAVGGKQNLRCS